MKKRIIKYMSVVLAAALVLCACGSNVFGNREGEVLMQLDAGKGLVTDEKSGAEEVQGTAACSADKEQSAIAEKTADTVAESVDGEVLAKDTQIYVYICGAVKNSGVYDVPQGSRLYEIVELAGGFTEDADETCLNLARQAQDGEQIVIRTKEEQAALLQQEQTTQGAVSGGLVNINTATAAELSTISGIGGTRAQAIIDYREKNGSFKTIEDIKKVDGIKDGLFSKIKDKITV